MREHLNDATQNWTWSRCDREVRYGLNNDSPDYCEINVGTPYSMVRYASTSRIEFARRTDLFSYFMMLFAILFHLCYRRDYHSSLYRLTLSEQNR